MKKISLYLLTILFNSTFLFGNFPPNITNISPLLNTTVVSGNNYFITYYASDFEPNPLFVQLYYNTNTSIFSAHIIYSNSIAQGFQTNIWNTTGIKEGQYYIIGRVLDFSNTWRTNRSPARVFVSNASVIGPTNTSPTISGIYPLTPITVASGTSYNIRYFINDVQDTNLFVQLYYNTNTSLTGAKTIYSNYRFLGTNFYNWNTTGVRQDAYYILGRVRDSSNAWGSGNSPATIFVTNTNIITPNNPPVINNITPLSPITISSGSSYNIYFNITDVESTNLLVWLYYNTTTNVLGATKIFSNYRSIGTNMFSWNTTGIPENYYYILGRVRDLNLAYDTNHSPARVYVSNASAPGPATGFISSISVRTAQAGTPFYINITSVTDIAGNPLSGIANIFITNQGISASLTNISFINGMGSNIQTIFTATTNKVSFKIKIASISNYKFISNVKPANALGSIDMLSTVTIVTVDHSINAPVSVTLYDTFGNIKFNATNSIYFKSSDPLAIFTNNITKPYKFSLTDRGTKIFNKTNFTFRTPGIQNLIVTNTAFGLRDVISGIQVVSILMTNTSPTISSIYPLTPITVASGTSYNIRYFINDAQDTNLFVQLYYNTNTSLTGAKTIYSNYRFLGTNFYNWNTTGVRQDAYYIIGRVRDSSNAWDSNNSPATIFVTNTNIIIPNNPPVIFNISPLSPITISSGSNYNIYYTITDVESTNLLVWLYYNTTTNLIGATKIFSNYRPLGTNLFNWSTTGIPENYYYILGRVRDLNLAYDTNRSPARVYVSNTSIAGPTNTPPTIFNISPQSPITVSSGSPYNIRYFINDTEDTNLMVLLYYNTTTNLIGATIIFSNYRPLGTNIFNWDTTSVTQNYYYMLGRVRDSSNVWAFNYSPSRVFVSNTSIISTNTNISDTIPPAPPTGIIMTPANKRITLQWNKNTEPDFKEYYVYRKSLSDNNFTIIAVTTNNSYEDKHLINGMLYYYKLRAADTDNNISDYSITVQGMPANFNRKNMVFNDNKITPKDPQELYINVQPMNNDTTDSVTVRIYNVAMKLIKQITINNSNGQYLYRWDLKDANNIKVPTGVYFIYVEGYNWKTYRTVYIIR